MCSTCIHQAFHIDRRIDHWVYYKHEFMRFRYDGKCNSQVKQNLYWWQTNVSTKRQHLYFISTEQFINCKKTSLYTTFDVVLMQLLSSSTFFSDCPWLLIMVIANDTKIGNCLRWRNRKRSRRPHHLIINTPKGMTQDNLSCRTKSCKFPQ